MAVTAAQVLESAVAHHRAGRLGEAQRLYRLILSQQPDEPQVLNALGVALIDSGEADDAIVCFQRALALQPDLAEAISNLGNALLQRGRIAEAIESCQN